MLNASNVTELPVDRDRRGVITDDDIDRSYDLLALIGVCGLAIDQCDELSEQFRTQALGNLSKVLRLAGEVAGQLHGVMEHVHMHQRAEVSKQ
jgi:hypothetical protein